jgi:hypothetical protein
MKAKDLIKILQKSPETEVMILCTRANPIKIETAYLDDDILKNEKRFIIETN